MELGADLDVVGAAARSFADRGEIEPGHARAARAHRDAAAVDVDAGIAVAVVAAQFVPARVQPGVALRVQRRAIDRRAGQRTEAVIVRTVEVDHIAMTLQHRDRRQEARALQAVLVQVGWRGIGAGDQDHAFDEHAVEQARQQHRVADVADEEFVEYQHAQLLAPFAGDARQRVALAGMRAQAFVHFAHEAMEMRAPLLADR